MSNVDNVSSSCARETGRAARNALTFYSPKAPVTDVCDSDVASLCLGSQGLQTMSLGQVCAFEPLCSGVKLPESMLDLHGSFVLAVGCMGMS